MTFEERKKRKEIILQLIKESGDKGITVKEINKKLSIKNGAKIVSCFTAEMPIYEENYKGKDTRYFYFYK